MTNMQVLFEMLNEQYTDTHFDALLQIVDRLHDAAAANMLETVSPLSAQELLGWLDDIIYTAQETVREIQANLATETEDWYTN